ncbi:hypothetical protein GCM10020218_029560 [Dactylosporangium vinaceum]
MPDTVLIRHGGPACIDYKVSGLMDELGKAGSQRVVEKHGPGSTRRCSSSTPDRPERLEQARVFTRGLAVYRYVVRTSWMGREGCIVIAVQRKLAIPVKLVGLGRGADDL